jgi:hypothetical protein
MSQLNLWNIFFGFLVIFIASCAGVFLADEATKSYLYNQTLQSSWQQLILQSAHGHTNSFGMLHILLGLTFPYSKLSLKIKTLQTIGLGAGTFAMSILMFLKSRGEPVVGYDVLGLVIGVCLSLTFISLLVHCCGIALKLRKIY